MGNRLAELESQIGAVAPPPGNRLAAMEAKAKAFDHVDAGKQFDSALAIADQTESPLGVVEAFQDEIMRDRDFYGVKIPGRRAGEVSGPVDPTDPFSRGERDPVDTRIALAEQIRRMDAVDWLKRVPFSPVGVMDAVDLMQAAKRLQDDKYDDLAQRLQEAETSPVESGKGFAQPWRGPNAAPGRNQQPTTNNQSPSALRDRDARRIEKYILEQIERQERGMTFGAKAFEAVSYLPAWMIEFSMTGGLAKLGSETAKTGAMRMLKGYAETKGGQAALRLAGWTGGAITRTTLGMPHRIGEAIAERRISNIQVGPHGEYSIATPEESWATSIAKGWAYAVIQTGTETAGAEILRPVAQFGANAIQKLPFGAKWYDGLRQAYLAGHSEQGAGAAFAERFFTKAGYDGILEEIGEERLATILTAITETEDFGLGEQAGPIERLQKGLSDDLNPENFAVELAVLGVPMAAKAALGQRGRIGPKAAEGPQKGVVTDAVQGKEEGRPQVAATPTEIGPQGQTSSPGGEPATTPTQTGPAQPEAPAASERGSSLPFTPPSVYTFEDYAAKLQGRDPKELRRIAKEIGAQIQTDNPQIMARWVGAAMEDLVSTPEPAAVLEGEPHPGSMDYKDFMARYGEALGSPEKPETRAWTARYGPEGPEGPRGLFRRLQEDWHRVRAWELFYELTEQARPEAGKSETAEPVAADYPRTEDEAREINAEEEARTTQEAVNALARIVPPADLPPAPPNARPGDPIPPERESTKEEMSWLRRACATVGGYYRSVRMDRLAEKELREIFAWLQLPNDRAMTFPQYAALRNLQVARQQETTTLISAMVERAKPYLDLVDEERKAVDELSVAIDQYPGDGGLHGRLMAQLKPRQIAGFRAFRKTLDDMGNLYLALMEEMGVRDEWIEQFRGRIGNYVMHNWYGDWAIVVRQKQTSEEKAANKKPATVYMSAVSYLDSAAEFERLQKLFPGDEVLPPLKRTDIPQEAYEAGYAPILELVEKVIAKANEKINGMRGISPEQADVVRQMAADLWKEKGQGVHFVHRNETPGWTGDLRRPFVEYIMGFAGSITKMRAALQFPEALALIDAQRTPNLFRRAAADVRYWMAEDRQWRRLKPVMYASYLHAVVRTATVNMTQNFILGWPVLAKHTNWSLAKLMDAMVAVAYESETELPPLTVPRGVAIPSLPLPARMEASERAYLKAKEDQGLIRAQMVEELSARGMSAARKALMTPIRKAWSLTDFQAAAERFNRKSMYLACLRAGLADPAAPPGADPADALVKEAHFEYGKANRPPAMRGLPSALWIFRTFQLNQLTWLKNEIKAHRVSPAARSIAAWMAVGGLKSLPLAGAAAAIYVVVFKRDPEKDAAELIGDEAAKVLFWGLPAAGGVTVTGSVGMDDLFPMPDPKEEWGDAIGRWVGGVTADLPMRAVRITQDLTHGQYYRAMEDAAPEALRNPMAAWRLYRQGATTRRGSPLIDPESLEQLRLTEGEAVLKSLGFQPQRLAKTYEKQRIIDRLDGGRIAARRAWIDRAFLAGKSGDREELDNIEKEIVEYNKAMVQRNRVSLTVPVEEVRKAAEDLFDPANKPTARGLLLYYELYHKEDEEEK